MSLISSAIDAAGSLVGGFLGSGAASNAGNVLQQGAQKAQGLISQGENNSQNFLNNTWQGTQGNFAPYLGLGQSSANSLAALLGQGFQAPSMQNVANSPQYKFNLQQGTNAILNNASATGNLLSGNTGVALENYGQGLASNSYQQAFNNALSSYQANLGGLMGGSQLGQGAATSLGYLGNQAAGLNTNINLGGSEAQAQQVNNAAAAQAGGILGSANAWEGAIGGMTNAIGGGFNLASLLNGPSSMYANFGDAPWVQGGSMGGPVAPVGGMTPSNPFPNGVVPGISYPTMPQF